MCSLLTLESYVFGSVCLFLCLFVGLLATYSNSKSYGQILMKFSGNVENGMRKN